MKKGRLVIVVGLLLILLSVFGRADLDTLINCLDTADCLATLGANFYCSPETTTCWQTETALVPSASPIPPAVPPVTASSDLDQRVKNLEANVQTIQQDTAALNTDLSGLKGEAATTREEAGALQRQISQVSNDLLSLFQSLNSVKQDLNPKIEQALAGQAALQDDLNATQTDLNTVADELAFTKFFTYAFFVLLVIAIALAVIYYINRGQTKGNNTVVKISPQVIDYITKQIKKGKKYPEIKNDLLGAGWSEKEISWVYQQTLQHNYKTYLAKKQGKQPANSGKNRASDKTRMLGLIAAGVLVILAIVFLLSGNVGKAVFFGQQVSNKTQELTYTVECTPPHILTPTKDACCLDENKNDICDISEREVAKVQEGLTCTDNLQCSSGKLCIDSQCHSVYELYKGSLACDKMCNYYTLKIATSDDESYNVKPLRGSYTGAGALEWKIMEAPNHCNGEGAIIPISITLKEPGKIISEEVITLRKGQTSRVLTNPSVPKLHFTLTLEDLHELCS